MLNHEARNGILMTLALEDSVEVSSLWNLYYHLHVAEDDLTLLRSHSKKLAEMAASMSSWQSGEYSKVLRFFDNHTREAVRSVWQWYSASSNSTLSHDLEKTLKRSAAVRKATVGDKTISMDMRSTSPLAFGQCSKELVAVREHFNRHRSLLLDIKKLAKARLANPMFLSAPNNNLVMHYGIEPLMGFHLAEAYTSGPEPKSRSLDTRMSALIDMAQKQFGRWIAAFKSCSSRVRVRVAVSDALALCESLACHDSGSAGDVDVGRINRFNVVETSNLIDHLGSLNLLVYVVPLLEQTPATTLHADLLVQEEATVAETISGLFHGDFSTISLLLGLQPAETWTNLSLVSPDEELNTSVLKAVGAVGDKIGQAHCRLLWKTVNVEHSRLHLDVESTAALLSAMHFNLFPKEDFKTLLAQGRPSKRFMGRRTKTSRGSFILFVALLKARHTCDWTKAIEKMVHNIEFKLDGMGFLFLQEFYSLLHVFGLYSPPAIASPAAHLDPSILRGLSLSTHNLPSMIYVTMKVPRKSLRIFTDRLDQPQTLGHPFFNAFIRSAGIMTRKSWENRFTIMEISFGDFQSAGSLGNLNAQTVIQRDDKGWTSTSSMLVTIVIPTWTALQSHAEADIGLALASTVQEVTSFGKELGVEMTVFKSKLNDTKQVALSFQVPVFAQDIEQRLEVLSIQDSKQIEPKLDAPGWALALGLSDQHKASTLTARISIPEGPALVSLREQCQVILSQTGPFCLSTTFQGKGHVFRQQFPVPVSSDQSKLRIARKSAYVEIIAGIAKLQAGSAQDDVFVHLNRENAILRSVPYVDLALSPQVSLQSSLDKWLNTHTSLQWSGVERKVREIYFDNAEGGPLPRVNAKESMLSMFMQYPGLQGHASTAFGLSLPPPKGVHVVILVAGLKMDAGNHTAMLDAAVIPLNPAKLASMSELLGALSQGGMNQILTNMAELQLWHGLLPLFTERCRSWSHKDKCKWKQGAPDSKKWHFEQDPLCECGTGVFPKDYPIKWKGWNKAKKYATRAAISPLYFVPYVDKVYEFPDQPGRDICHGCRKSQGGSVQKLSACARCKAVSYCSKECQKKDWPAHKRVCK